MFDKIKAVCRVSKSGRPVLTLAGRDFESAFRGQPQRRAADKALVVKRRVRLLAALLQIGADRRHQTLLEFAYFEAPARWRSIGSLIDFASSLLAPRKVTKRANPQANASANA